MWWWWRIPTAILKRPCVDQPWPVVWISWVVNLVWSSRSTCRHPPLQYSIKWIYILIIPHFNNRMILWFIMQKFLIQFLAGLQNIHPANIWWMVGWCAGGCVGGQMGGYPCNRVNTLCIINSSHTSNWHSLYSCYGYAWLFESHHFFRKIYM